MGERGAMRFVGRQRELDTLEGLYNAGGFQMPIVYGRRRVGKTSLVNRFMQGKPGAVFTARETSAKDNLAALSRAIVAIERDDPSIDDAPAVAFASFEEAFSRLFAVAEARPIVFAIDEYPYLAQSDRSISSLLQAMIDQRKSRSSLCLILCGSSMSFMEHQVLGYKSPLYGRRTAQIKVEPFDIFQAAQLLEGCDAETVVSWYGMVGGVPLYLEQHDSTLGLEENMARNILRPDCFLYGEPDSFLQQELRDPARYNAVIQAMASGVGRLSEIADSAGLERTAVMGYLKSLIELGIVEREEPVMDANRKKVRYRISDNLFKFWYRFVPRYLTPIQAGRQDQVADLVAKEALPTFLGGAFEQVCRQWLVESMGTDGIPLILDIGRWWGADRELRQEAEVDVVALCDDGSTIFGECKWRNRATDADVLERLVHRAGLFPPGEKRLFLFSKGSFTKECRQQAGRVGCRLVTLDDMRIAP